MLKNLFSYKLLIGYLIVLIFICTSCKSYQNIAYFQDLPDSLKITKLQQAKYLQPVIQPDDILSIVVQTIDPASVASINLAPSVSGAGLSAINPIGNQQISGFLVDKNGQVQLAMIGKVNLIGLTTDEARDLITKKVSEFYKDPSVQVRFANFKVTVIGEVAKPATYTVVNEKVSLLDALGYAGDLTIYGKRENLLLIRDNNGQKEFVRLNLNSSEIFKSPYFYLKQNDVIYIEPNKAKAATTDASRTRMFTILASVISVAIVIISRI